MIDLGTLYDVILWNPLPPLTLNILRLPASPYFQINLSRIKSVLKYSEKMKGFLRNIKGRFIFQITSTIPSRSCEARVGLFVLGLVLEDGHVREVYILY